MNDSVLENEKNTAPVNNSNNEEKDKENTQADIIKTADGDKVDKTTGEIINSKDGDSEKKGEDAVSSTDKPQTQDSPKPKEPTEAEKENTMRQEVRNLGLKYLDVNLMYEVMSVPTCTDFEYRMVTYLILWARKNNIQHSFDTHGNLYFVKGKPEAGKFYPCVTAHLDTVQQKAKAYVMTGAELDLRTRLNTKKQHEVYIDGMGTGSDDKNAIVIALHMFEKFDVLKGAFFLGEEAGCKGSKEMDDSFFEDVSYVIGFDSPELNRAAWKLSFGGDIKMFTADFYKKYMKPVCDKWGMTYFKSESFTDEAIITKDTGLITMNFGNGGYSAHMPTEYFIVEELDHALGMGLELVETIPTDVQHKVKKITWVKDEKTGQYSRHEEEIGVGDEAYLKTLGDNRYYSNYNYGGYSRDYNTYGGSNYDYSNRSDGYWDKSKKEKDKQDNMITKETLEYIVGIYDERINDIQKAVEAECKTLGLDFKESFAKVFSKEIVF